jgi:hypothetical protein
MTAVPNWQGKTAVVICAGPSLSDEQIDTIICYAPKTIAVNTAYLYAPHSDVIYAGDMMFWRAHHQRIRTFCAESSLWTCDSGAAERFAISRQRAGNREGLGREVLHMNGNSGFQAINLAYLWGARRILLVGMDMREIDGRKHRHGDHEKGLVQAQQFDEWLHKSVKLAADLKEVGCDVANCTPGSALKCFRMSTVEEELV